MVVEVDFRRALDEISLDLLPTGELLQKLITVEEQFDVRTFPIEVTEPSIGTMPQCWHSDVVGRRTYTKVGIGRRSGRVVGGQFG